MPKNMAFGSDIKIRTQVKRFIEIFINFSTGIIVYGNEILLVYQSNVKYAFCYK